MNTYPKHHLSMEMIIPNAFIELQNAGDKRLIVFFKDIRAYARQAAKWLKNIGCECTVDATWKSAVAFCEKNPEIFKADIRNGEKCIHVKTNNTKSLACMFRVGIAFHEAETPYHYLDDVFALVSYEAVKVLRPQNSEDIMKHGRTIPPWVYGDKRDPHKRSGRGRPCTLARNPKLIKDTAKAYWGKRQ